MIRTYQLLIENLLLQPIQLSGVKFDAYVECVLKCTLNVDPSTFVENLKIEIESLEIRTIYIFAPTLRDPMLELDQVQFKSRHPSLYADLLDEIDFEALKRGYETPLDEWELI